jgi:hypothetical protein
MNQQEITEIGTELEIIMDFIERFSEYNLPNRCNKLIKRANNNINKMYQEMSLYNNDKNLYKQEIKIIKRNK